MTKAQQATEKWVDVNEAAATLDVSTRQIMRRAKLGYIRKTTLPRGIAEKTARVLYSEPDIRAIQEGNPNHVTPQKTTHRPPHAAAAIGPVLAAVASPQASAWEGLAKYLAELTITVKALNAAHAPVSSDTGKSWLTLDEAAAFSGLPKAYLRKEARRSLQMTLFPEKGEPRHEFVVRNVGTVTREQFMFSRESLKG
jgi:hypothetical protein